MLKLNIKKYSTKCFVPAILRLQEIERRILEFGRKDLSNVNFLNIKASFAK
jgi:hypothetical protein